MLGEHAKLDMHYSGGRVLSMALTVCPNLWILTLHGIYEAYSAEFFTHPMLTSPFITAHAKLGNFFFMATLSSLHELRIITTSCGQHDNVHTFLTLVGCSLKTLWVCAWGSVVWTEGEQEELMELIPTLTHLVLNT